MGPSALFPLYAKLVSSPGNTGLLSSPCHEEQNKTEPRQSFYLLPGSCMTRNPHKCSFGGQTLRWDRRLLPGPGARAHGHVLPGKHHVVTHGDQGVMTNRVCEAPVLGCDGSRSIGTWCDRRFPADKLTSWTEVQSISGNLTGLPPEVLGTMAVAVLVVSSLWSERGREGSSRPGSASRKCHTGGGAASVGAAPTAAGRAVHK